MSALLEDNFKKIRARMMAALQRSGRAETSVRLVAATKYGDADLVAALAAVGCKDIGENRVQDAEAKKAQCPTHLEWHMIGHLQSNKAKKAVDIFSWIHSVDSWALAQAIERHAAAKQKRIDVLIQVNVSGEQSKEGVDPTAVHELVGKIKTLTHVQVHGLMTMVPVVKNVEEVRPYFRQLRQLADAEDLKECSMGMSHDFEVAIEEGATMVRIGSALVEGWKKD